jgi:hypothetical protein
MREVNCSKWYNKFLVSILPKYFVCKAMPPPTYKYIPGDKNDAGAEIWNPSFNGMDVRLSVDDVDNLNRCGIPAVGSWYPLDASVLPPDSIVLSVDANGNAVVAGKDFPSLRTGMQYHYCGCLVGTSSGQLQTASPLTIPKSSCSGTLRIMLATVEK